MTLSSSSRWCSDPFVVSGMRSQRVPFVWLKLQAPSSDSGTGTGQVVTSLCLLRPSHFSLRLPELESGRLSAIQVLVEQLHRRYKKHNCPAPIRSSAHGLSLAKIRLLFRVWAVACALWTLAFLAERRGPVICQHAWTLVLV